MRICYGKTRRVQATTRKTSNRGCRPLKTCTAHLLQTKLCSWVSVNHRTWDHRRAGVLFVVRRRISVALLLPSNSVVMIGAVGLLFFLCFTLGRHDDLPVGFRVVLPLMPLLSLYSMVVSCSLHLFFLRGAMVFIESKVYEWVDVTHCITIYSAKC